MSSTLTEERIELTELSPPRNSSLPLTTTTAQDPDPDSIPEDAAYSTTAIPDGGYGWVVVFCCSVTAFWSNGVINCWGVLQAALLDSSLSSVPTSTVSFVGSLGLALSAGLGIFVVQLMRWTGSRTTCMAGICLMGVSLIASGFLTGDVGGLFGTMGVMAGLGMSMVYTVSNGLVIQYFSGHLGLANGLIKLGGGIGGCVLAVALEAMYRRVGIAWTFRIQGFLTLATGLPAAWMQTDRVPPRKVPFVDISMFRSLPFVTIFFAGAIGSFALFVPPYFLPLFAQSIGLSPSTGAGLVAAFNACNAVGRFVAGPLCDKIGPVNMFLITMALNAISTYITLLYKTDVVFSIVEKDTSLGTLPTILTYTDVRIRHVGYLARL